MATQVSLNDGAVASAGALAIQTNGTTQAVSISTGQVATLAQNPILTSGTANGVAYLNGSKVLTTGSALVFDGTNLGIGTSSPGSFAAAGRNLVVGTGTGNNGLTIYSGNASGSNIYFADGTTGAETYAGFIQYAHSTNAMLFGVNNTGSEAMTLNASGNFRIGNTTGGTRRMQVESASANFTIGAYNTNGTPYGFYAEYSTSPNNTGSQFFQGVDSTASRFEARANGGIANYSANNVNLSDRREKTNFAPAKSYLDVICAIPVQTFNYIDQNLEEDAGLTLGVVAQDVQAVAPELVSESNWAKQGDEPKMRLSIYQTDLQYALMKCIQEQQALIIQLTARITALEGA